MNMHKVRQLATLLHTNYSPEVQRYVSSELEGLGLTIAEMYHFLEMKTPFVEVFRDAGEKNTSSAIHSHRFLEIVYCQSSYGAQYLIGSQRYDLQHGDIVIVPPGVSHPAVQRELLERSLTCFGDKICVLHVKDGVWNSENQWENRPLGEGIMDWKTLLPILRKHDDRLCALREGVWPGKADEEYEMMRRWAQM